MTEKTLKETIKELNETSRKVHKFFQDIDVTDVPNLLRAFKTLDENLDELELVCKMLKVLREKISTEVIPNTFESLGIDSVKLAGRNFIVSSQMFANIPADKQEAGFTWLRENNLENLIKDNVNSKSLSSAIREYFEEKGMYPPEDTMTIFQKKYTSIKKA